MATSIFCPRLCPSQSFGGPHIWHWYRNSLDKSINRVWRYAGVHTGFYRRGPCFADWLGQAKSSNHNATHWRWKVKGRSFLVDALCAALSVFPVLVTMRYPRDAPTFTAVSNRLINLVSPLLGFPVGPFFWSTLLGSMPYNFICTQAGDVLGNVTSTSDILTLSHFLKLLFISILSLIPVFWGNMIQRYLRNLFGLPSLVDGDVEKLTTSASG